MTDSQLPLAPTLLALAVALPLARAGGVLARKLGQPEVLGELLAGLLLGVLPLLGVTSPFAGDALNPIELLAELGAAVLLFEAGLDSEPSELLRAGLAATLVAPVGVLAPTLLGMLAARLLLPEGTSPIATAFIGATLSATSVGITVRVLRDLGQSHTREARIVLGAAVVDDVLGLLLLSLLVAVARAEDAGGSVSVSDTLVLLAKAVAFLGLAVAVLPAVLRRLPVRARHHLGSVPFGLALCFLLCWASDEIGLAPVVGAFAAGVALASARLEQPAPGSYQISYQGTLPLRAGLSGIASLLVPLFFLAMGLRVDLDAATRGHAPLLALVLVLVAIVGKLLSGLAAPGRGLNRLAIGVGMIPRGEVGLIFAGIGQKLTLHGEPLVGPGVSSALVVVMLVTTLVTPPALRLVFAREARRAARAAASTHGS